MKKNGIDTTTNLPMGAILHDGMGCLARDLRQDVREIFLFLIARHAEQERKARQRIAQIVRNKPQIVITPVPDVSA